jgi:hypothetical protein
MMRTADDLRESAVGGQKVVLTEVARPALGGLTRPESGLE